MQSRASGSATGVPDDPAGSGNRSSLLRVTPMGLVDIVLLAIVLVVGVSAATWALVGMASGSTSGVAANVFVATSVLLASILTLVAALRRWRHGLPVWPWLGLTLACHVWLVGEAVRVVTQYYLGDAVGVPSFVDASLLAFAPLVLIAFRPMFARPGGAIGQAGLALDAALLVLLLTLLAASPAMGDWLGQGSGSGLVRVVTVAWLVGAVLLVLPAIPAVMATPAEDRPWLWPVLGGQAVIGVGQVLYAGAFDEATATIPAGVALTWSLGFLAMATGAVLGGWLSRTVAGGVTAGGAPPARRADPILPATHGGLTIVAAGVLGLVIVVVALTTSVSAPLQWLIVTIGLALSVRFVLTAIQAERLLAGSVARQVGERLEAVRRARVAAGDRPTQAVSTAIAEVLGVEGVGFDAPATDPAASRDRHAIVLPAPAVPGASPDGAPAPTFRFTPRTTTDRFRFDARLAAARPWIVEAAAAALAGEPGWHREGLIAALRCWRIEVADGAASLSDRVDTLREATGAVSTTLDRVDPTTGEPSRIAASGGSRSVDGEGDDATAGAVSISGSRPIADDQLDLTIVWAAGGARLDRADAEALIDIALGGLLPAVTTSAPVGTADERYRAAIAALVGAATTSAALDGLTRAVTSSGPASHAALLRWDPISDEYTVSAMTARAGHPPIFLPDERGSMAMLPSLRDVLVSRREATGPTGDVFKTATETQLARRAGIVRVAVLPMVRLDRCFGLLVVGAARPVGFDPADLDLFRSVAGLAGTVVECDRLDHGQPEQPGRDDVEIL